MHRTLARPPLARTPLARPPLARPPLAHHGVARELGARDPRTQDLGAGHRLPPARRRQDARAVVAARPAEHRPFDHPYAWEGLVALMVLAQGLLVVALSWVL